MNQVLLIDDEIDFCQLLQEQMAKQQVPFQCAHTLADGTQKLETERPDVLLLDNDLPDGPGWKSAARLQKQFPNMRIVLISALAQPGYDETGIGLQFARVAKPLTFLDLQPYLA